MEQIRKFIKLQSAIPLLSLLMKACSHTQITVVAGCEPNKELTTLTFFVVRLVCVY